MEHDDAEALGGLGIVLHRTPPIAPLGILEDPGHEPGRARKSEREVEIRDLVAWKLEQEPAVAANGDLDAEGGADPVPIEEQEIAGLGDHDRRDGEIVPAQAKAWIAERQGDGSGQRAASHHADPGDDPELREQDRGHIGAETEIQGVAERDLSAIAAEDVPALRERREHQGQHQNVLGVDIRHE